MKEKINDYDLLYEAAYKAYLNAYTPYSKFNVGASILLDDGKIINGCNVENSSYGLCICAERNTLFKAISEGYKKENIVRMLVLGNTSAPISPCGACRQVISELVGENCDVILTNIKKDVKVLKVKDLIPYPFSGDNLNE